MASPSVAFNPAIQTNFAGTFAVSSEGYQQGDAQDDPSIRNELRRGIVDPAATLPMWGGLAISESLLAGGIGVGTTNPAGSLQSKLVPATNVTANTAANLTGFTVFNQATAMLVSAQSRVPQAPSSGSINFYRLGSRARIPFAASAAALSAWIGGLTDPNTLFWDTNNLWLTNAGGSGIFQLPASITIDSISAANSRVVNYNQNSAGYATSGFLNWLEGQGAVVLKI